jgi:hypothetical protein
MFSLPNRSVKPVVDKRQCHRDEDARQHTEDEHAEHRRHRARSLM